MISLGKAMFGPSFLEALMPLGDCSYVPALRWRMAEYQALHRLDEAIKRRIVPLITIPPVEFDFEIGAPKKTVHEHVHPFVARYRKKWGMRPAWLALDESVALDHMNGGEHVFDYLLPRLRPDTLVIPAIGLLADPRTKAAVSQAVKRDQQGVGLILSVEDLIGGDVGARVRALLAELGATVEDTDVLIDMKAPQHYEPYGVFSTALIGGMGRLGALSAFRNLVLIGTAIPESFRSLRKGTDEIPRHDWLFYQAFRSLLPTGMRRPTYGDYTTIHPDFVAADMRMVKPAAKVVYATRSTWATRKGSAFRDDREQMHAHCATIVGDPCFGFRGVGFSFGDKYIGMCAIRAEGPSNSTRWKEVGINHHITTVVDDLAKLYA